MTNSSTQLTALNIGAAPSLAMGMTYIAMADSVAHLMSNAVSAEKFSQVIQNANVTQCCALILPVGAVSAA